MNTNKDIIAEGNTNGVLAADEEVGKYLGKVINPIQDGDGPKSPTYPAVFSLQPLHTENLVLKLSDF